MSDLFILLEHVPHEGDTLLGVYSSRKNAEGASAKLQETERKKGWLSGQHKIEQRALDADAKDTTFE